mgnify:CR=1 FL=1
MAKDFILRVEDSIKKHWDCDALTDYKGSTLQYKDVARRIEKLHILFEEVGVVPGDKISLCGRNSSNWGVAFLAALTYGAVPVPILHEFKADNVHNIINHSDSKLAFIGENNWENLNEEEIPNVLGVIGLENYDLLVSRDEKLTYAREHLNELFGKKFPMRFEKNMISYYHNNQPDELAIINYTSGSTGFSKGVMIPYRAIFSNIEFGRKVLPGLNNTHSVVSMLPCAHMYGLMFELLYELSVGAHVHFLSRVPSPKIIMQALSEVKPYVVIAVPLVIEKIYKNKVKPILEKEGVRFLMKVPGVNQVIMNKIKTELINAFGGEFYEVIIGGAAFNTEVEAFFKKMGFPFTVGYGMTECAPIITYDDWKEEKLFSCGKAAPNMQVRIASADPVNIPGEIQIKGANVFLGYFKNEEATAEVFTEDGWFKTGDMGILDAEGSLFIKGRTKCMILGPSGQNIYPEEVETVVNSQPYVVDSLVIEDDGGLTALIYPDFQQGEKEGMSQEAMVKYMEGTLAELNTILPNYARLKKIEVMSEDFERTPKKSIKRYLYQR